MAVYEDETKNVQVHTGTGVGTPVTGTTDGSKHRLDVDSNVAGGVVIQKFSTKAASEVDSAVSLNTSTDSSLFSFTGEGKLDFIAVTGPTSSNYEVAIIIDGVERFRLTMAALGTLGLTNPENVPIWADTAQKNFRYHPNEGDDFATSFEVIAKATTGTPSVYWAIKYREAVPA